MPIAIIDVDPSDYTPDDKLAHATATKWVKRIEELFLTERSFQQSIGISEVGSDCRKCVARKLAGVPKKPEGSWFPFIGTSVHQALEDGFASRDWQHEYFLENRLHVHSYKGLELGGSCDMAAISEFTEDGHHRLVVNDWKIVGETTLKDAAKKKIKQQYRIQAMLYGLGWKNKGYDVTHVALSFLPRDKRLAEAQIVMLRYDEQVAMEALAKLEMMIDAAEIVGWDAVINKQPKASFCYDCKRYEQAEENDLESFLKR
jgi:hypothetical protein